MTFCEDFEEGPNYRDRMGPCSLRSDPTLTSTLVVKTEGRVRRRRWDESLPLAPVWWTSLYRLILYTGTRNYSLFPVDLFCSSSFSDRSDLSPTVTSLWRPTDTGRALRYRKEISEERRRFRVRSHCPTGASSNHSKKEKKKYKYREGKKSTNTERVKKKRKIDWDLLKNLFVY